ncbi:MAG: hypothetical protein AAFQ41_01115 [Cyanobacteria bacterium J06623_7]
MLWSTSPHVVVRGLSGEDWQFGDRPKKWESIRLCQGNTPYFWSISKLFA